MPAKGQTYATTLCAAIGCIEPRYQYPGGGLSPYCRAHNKRRRMKNRDGQDPMSGRMQDILEYLLACKQQDALFVELSYPLVHYKSLNRLIAQGRVFKSAGMDGVRYCITDAGEEALAPFSEYVNRRDGICPRCCERTRHVRSSGIRDAYCIECLRELSQEERDLGIQHVDPDRMCSRCHVRPLYQYPGGLYSSYCEECENARRRENARKLRRARFEQYQVDGLLPLCKRCKVQPVRVFPNCLSELCPDCYRRQAHRTKLNKVFKRAVPRQAVRIHLKPLARTLPEERSAAQRQKELLRLDYVPDDHVALIMRAMLNGGPTAMPSQGISTKVRGRTAFHPAEDITEPRPAWHEDERKVWKRRLLRMDIGDIMDFPGGIYVKRAEFSYTLHIGGKKLDLTAVIGHEPDRERRVEKIIDWIVETTEETNMGTLLLTDGQISILRQLKSNGTLLKNQFDPDDLVVLLDSGMVRDLGDRRIDIRRHGSNYLESLAQEGDGQTLEGEEKQNMPALSDASLETLRDIAQGVERRFSPPLLQKLRDLDYIGMGTERWEIRTAGRERLIAQGLLEAPETQAELPAPLEGDTDSETASDDEAQAGSITAQESASDADVVRVSYISGNTWQDTTDEELAALDGMPNSVLTLPTSEARLVEMQSSVVLPAVEFDPEAGPEAINRFAAALENAEQDGACACDGAAPCLARRVLDRLMSLSPTARSIFEHEAALDELSERLRGS